MDKQKGNMNRFIVATIYIGVFLYHIPTFILCAIQGACIGLWNSALANLTLLLAMRELGFWHTTRSLWRVWRYHRSIERAERRAKRRDAWMNSRTVAVIQIAMHKVGEIALRCSFLGSRLTQRKGPKLEHVNINGDGRQQLYSLTGKPLFSSKASERN